MQYGGRQVSDMADGILIYKIFYGLIISIVGIILIINMLREREPIGRKRINFKNRILKFIYKILIPIILVLGIVQIFIYPLADYFDPNKYSYSDTGVLEAISTHNSAKQSGRNEYTIKINGNTYRLSERLISYDNLKKGNEYSIYYFKRSRIVYFITEE